MIGVHLHDCKQFISPMILYSISNSNRNRHHHLLMIEIKYDTASSNPNPTRNYWCNLNSEIIWIGVFESNSIASANVTKNIVKILINSRKQTLVWGHRVNSKEDLVFRRTPGNVSISFSNDKMGERELIWE